MNIRLGIVAATIALVGIAGLPLAEAGVIKNREVRQQKRIGQGVESGQLTAKETAKLEREEAKIEADREKALADGKITRKGQAVSAAAHQAKADARAAGTQVGAAVSGAVHKAQRTARDREAKEKAKLTREQNRASRHIYKEKHDAQKQPGAK